MRFMQSVWTSLKEESYSKYSQSILGDAGLVEGRPDSGLLIIDDPLHERVGPDERLRLRRGREPELAVASDILRQQRRSVIGYSTIMTE